MAGCPSLVPRKRWRDQVRRDLQSIGVQESEWYSEARRSRAGWRTLYRMGMEAGREDATVRMTAGSRDVLCEACGRSFRREGDKKGISVWINVESQ